MELVGRTYKIWNGVNGYKLWGFAFPDGGDSLLIVELFDTTNSWVPIDFIPLPEEGEDLELWIKDRVVKVMNGLINARYPIKVVEVDEPKLDLHRSIRDRISNAVQYYEVNERGYLTKRGFNYVPVDNGSV